MQNKVALTILCGGESTEHEISVRSTMNILKALKRDKYTLAVIYITHQGEWYYTADVDACLEKGIPQLKQAGELLPVALHLDNAKPTFWVDGNSIAADCVFPILHGTHGEDGCVQGLLQLMKVAYVGDNVLSSAMCMDKEITKQLLQANGIATTPWISLTNAQFTTNTYAEATQALGQTLFVKPNSLGSSVGVSKVSTKEEFIHAVSQGLRYDERVLVESCIQGREIECAVLGNEEPIASLPAEITCHHSFYSYQAKYMDPQGATTTVPAKLAQEIISQVRKLAVDAFKILRCSGLLRVDFFLLENNTLLINEVNTIPGFTNISMYPQMWQASGISYSDLLDELIHLALARHQTLNQLDRVFVQVENPGDLASKDRVSE